jgi:hypothetical protein
MRIGLVTDGLPALPFEELLQNSGGTADRDAGVRLRQLVARAAFDLELLLASARRGTRFWAGSRRMGWRSAR